MMEGIQDATNTWTHYVPFACMVAGKPIPENRPALTRIIEQSFVGLVAAAMGSYVTLQVNTRDISELKTARQHDNTQTAEAIKESEQRVTAQIVELRSILLKK